MITSLGTSPGQLAALRAALDEVAADSGLREVRQTLLLEGLSLAPIEHYRAVLRLQEIAGGLGYPIWREVALERRSARGRPGYSAAIWSGPLAQRCSGTGRPRWPRRVSCSYSVRNRPAGWE